MSTIITTPATAGSLRTGGGDKAISEIVIVSDVNHTAPYTSDSAQFCACSVVVQIGGTATAFTCQVQRSDLNPSGPAGANWVPAAAALTGDAATGFNPVVYSEPTTAWWNLVFSAISGGTITASISGVKP